MDSWIFRGKLCQENMITIQLKDTCMTSRLTFEPSRKIWNIRAVEEDLEYYRAKRFEPRIFYLIRRGVVTFYDLLKARVALKRSDQFFKLKNPQGKNIEARVRYLEEWLDEYVKGIALVSARAMEAMDMVTEDNRKERGDYDDFFKIKKKEHHGTLEERIVNLEQDLKDYQELLEGFVHALIKRG